MFCHEELSRVRGAAVSETRSVPNCKKYLDWHKQAKPKDGRSAAAARTPFSAAKLKGIDWQKLEALVDSGQVAS